MEQLNLLTGQTKTEIAIDFIREHEPEEGYFVGFSGGKDSIVVLDLVQKAGVKHQAYYSATGIDPPEVVKFINTNYPYVIHKRPNHKGIKSFYGMIPVIGYPTNFARWCCDKLKKDPTRSIPLPNRIMGIRAEESSNRAKRGQISHFKKMKQWLYKPIFYWLEWEVWDYIEANNLPFPSMYDEGFSRIGCVICPFICGKNQAQIERNRDRWPKHYAAFDKAMRRLWDDRESVRQRKRGFANTFEEFLDNWYHGNRSDGH
uniref:Putative phosphoadenosine phosphosulfate n=1 Tax=viral metagenome TaxID=1070528 RepID=A0A6M3LVY5_9ZZZZ